MRKGQHTSISRWPYKILCCMLFGSVTVFCTVQKSKPSFALRHRLAAALMAVPGADDPAVVPQTVSDSLSLLLLFLLLFYRWQWRCHFRG